MRGGSVGHSLLFVLASAASVTVSRQLEDTQQDEEDNSSHHHPNSVYSEFSKYNSRSLRVFYQTGVSKPQPGILLFLDIKKKLN